MRARLPEKYALSVKPEKGETLEAGVGIEPPHTALQAAAVVIKSTFYSL